jgi:hypothetical protein
MVKILRHFFAPVKIESGLKMGYHENRVVQQLRSFFDVPGFERFLRVDQILNDLVVKQDDQAIGGGAVDIVLAIGVASVRHGAYFVDVPVLGVVLEEGAATLKLPLSAPMIAVTVNRSEGYDSSVALTRE